MPNRILRDYTDSLAVDQLDWLGECLFVRLIQKADDYGRFHGNPTLVRSLLFPLKNGLRDSDISARLAACEKAGLIRVYESNGKPFIEIVNFGQRLKAGARSKYPEPPWQNSREVPETSGNFREVPGSAGKCREVPARDGDGDGDEGGRYPARGAGAHTPAHAHEEIPAGYPKSVEEVMAIAADPRCAVEITREQAEAYFLARDTADWIDAARRKIQPGKVYGDLRRWVMKDRQRDGGTAGAVSTAEAEFEELCRRNEAIRRNL